MGYTILMIEDDCQIGELLKKILEREGYTVRWETSGINIAGLAGEADLVLLDVMLPGEDGFRLAERIKGSGIPVLFLSALIDIDSRLRGLSAGGDYLSKPFDPRELLIRIEKLLHHAYGGYLQIGHIHIQADTRQVFIGGRRSEAGFTPTEKKIFFYLYENRNKILTKEHFLEYLWQLEDRSPNIINVHIQKIRAKIGDSRGGIIENVYGEGYRLNTRIRA
ncbi:response regulator transcription factor [Peribacillus sp. SCS-26]|uniref:response regulator transcription factor n=1 Tax=Paraperibacillus marinus TaxID=3115295 RepID=UPI0039059753